MNSLKISDFKKPKYVIPTFVWIGLLVIPYLFVEVFNVEIEDKKDANLQTTEYLNAQLPSANVSKDIGSKRKNMRDAFGDITDRSAVQDFMENMDTINRKEDFESKYSEEELRQLAEQQREVDAQKRLQELNSRVSQSAQRGQQMGSDDFVVPMTDEERAKALAMRRNGLMGDMERDLNNARARGAAGIDAVAEAQDSLIGRGVKATRDVVDEAANAVRELDDDAQNNIVTKVSKDDSEYFNTLSENAPGSNLIKAIIDEEIKAVEGSRVRLRLLDDIDINGTRMAKGSYLYATMSGFGQQRVKGKVQSVLVGDEILKIGLSIYDVTDGLEGLYVPASQFRETAKDIGSTAMQSNMNLNNASGGTSVAQWAGQAIQNAYQKTSNAIGKAIKKNRVRLKYGTQVYLVNSKQSRKK